MSVDQLTPFEIQLRNQILKNWKNYRVKRIDLAIARERTQFDIAGKYICVAKVSDRNAAAAIRINEKDNDEMELEDGVEIGTLFKHFFITNTVQVSKWIDLIIGADFEYKKKIKRLEYVWRDVVAADFTAVDFVTDGAWHFLDLSAIVPVGAKLVHFNLYASHSTAALQMFVLAKVGASSIEAGSILFTNWADWLTSSDCWVAPYQPNMWIQYLANVGVWSTINLTVRGWWI